TASTNTLTRLLDVKSGVAATQGFASSATNVNEMIARWQTKPLANDTSFATTNTVQYVVGSVTSSTTNTTMHFRVHIYIIESDDITIRGILLRNFTGAGTAWTA